MAREAVETATSIWSAESGRTEELVAQWLEAVRQGSGAAESRGSGHLLDGLRRDPESFEFTRRLLEFVAGTDDAFASAIALHAMAREAPESMPSRDRLAVRAGGAASLGLPWAVMPVARKWLRDRVSGLVLAAKFPDPAGRRIASAGRLSALNEALRRFTELGVKPVLVPLGDEPHGSRAAAVEVARLAALARLPQVTHLVVDLARIAPGGSDWSFDSDVTRAAAALEPVLRAAAEHSTTVHLEARSVRWARMLPDVTIRALVDPEFDRARVGVRLLAELPESREFYGRLSRWAQRRVADGGAPAEVVIGVGGVAGAERIASIESGLPVPVLEDPIEVTAQLLRLAELALHPARAAVLRPVIATEDVHVLAGVVACAEALGSAELYALQLRSGVAPGLAEALRKSAREVRVSVPAVPPKEFGGALDFLVSIAAEAADHASAISRLEALVASGEQPDATLEDATRAFSIACARAADPPPSSHRTQHRAREWDPSERDSGLFYRAPDEPTRFDTGGLTAAVLGLTRGSEGEFTLEPVAPPRAIPVVSESGFANEPSTDATVAANRDWVRELLTRAAEDAREVDERNATVALSPADLDPGSAAETARDRAEVWAVQSHRTRATRLRRAALAVLAARDRLIRNLALESGAPVSQLDAEVDGIADAARYCAQLAEGLAAVRGATFVPDRLVLVVADAATPLSVQAESVFAALAAGSGVIWAAPGSLSRSAHALVEECEAGGLTPGVVRLEVTVIGRTIADLAAHPGIDRAVVLGSRDDARELSRSGPDLRVEGRFRARGSILVTPTADLDCVIEDIVASAFACSAGDPRAARQVLVLGSVARSRRFRDGLADAVRSLHPGDIARPRGGDPLAFSVGPLPAEPSASGLRALTELDRGESWLVEPRRLDEAGRLWSPGVRIGVAPSSTFWSDARDVPVIGLCAVHSLADAVEAQNAAGGGGVAAIHSHDQDEIAGWLETVEAASLLVNRTTTGTRIERHPGGGWNEAGMGLGGLAGGPNRLVALGAWRVRAGSRSDTLHLRGLDPEVRALIESAQPDLTYEEFDAVRRAALADALVWRTSLGVDRDPIGLGIERNVIRHHPVPTHVRLAEGGSVASLVRVVAAAMLVRAPLTISTGELLPQGIAAYLEQRDVEVSLERDDAWLERLAVAGPVSADGRVALRVRLIDGNRTQAVEWLGRQDHVAVWAEPVTLAGPVELLTMLREQAVSVRAHRHGLAVSAPGLDADIAP
ncbi:proline dehydrogenase family protein [Leucobacter sp. USHLN153]|uniref:proline dehydrogenase family protein n=1 Tax=Leucobacter sp. USHLN153 TaxID=3081268 RepID=UPI003017BE26